jgi:hypothetical protein
MDWKSSSLYMSKWQVDGVQWPHYLKQPGTQQLWTSSKNHHVRLEVGDARAKWLKGRGCLATAQCRQQAEAADPVDHVDEAVASRW